MKRLFTKFPFRSVSTMKKSYPEQRFFETEDKTGLNFSLEDRPGSLLEALKVFSDNKVNLTYISSKPSKFTHGTPKHIDFFIDFDGRLNDSNVQQALNGLRTLSKKIDMSKIEEIPWFPKSIYDLNQIGRVLMSAGKQLSSDHPGFKDEVYRKRRDEIVKISNSYNMEDGLNVPEVKYTDEETKLWGSIWDKLIPLHNKHACKEFLDSFDSFQRECGFRREEIPQLKIISAFLKQKTNFLYRPVGGLLTQREFLNGLAFRVFHSTQYIRHHSKPLYTPEPDIIHEILGHAPLFADKDFADFSQELGLASLAASDEDIAKLGTIYWFTVEFGVCMQNGERKAYGAGILSSPSEIEWAMSDNPKFHPLDLWKVAVRPYTITEIQQDYFLATSFKDMRKAVTKYAEEIRRPFNVTYDSDTGNVNVDRKIATRVESNTPEGDKLF
jgi:phenylalanine-4-hydroxylase